MAKKSRPSFDAPKRATSAKPAAAGWVYKSDEKVVASHQSPVVSPEPVVQSIVKRASVSSVSSVVGSVRARPIDRIVVPFTLLVMTVLAPVSLLRGKR